MKFCPVFPEICRGQVHGPRKERRKRRKRKRKRRKRKRKRRKRKRKRIIIMIIIIRRNGAKTISLPNVWET